jgi:uncharacterized protein (DUF1810 family)
MFDLDRFKRAQEHSYDGFDTALSELQAGRKRSHWIWYIFPQLAGLGHSSMAVQYGLLGPAEAAAYLRDPVLRERLLAVTNAVTVQLQRQPAPSLVALMGSEIDVVKLVSSMTLFGEMARRANHADPDSGVAAFGAHAEAILRVAEAQGYHKCASTIRELENQGSTDSV